MPYFSQNNVNFNNTHNSIIFFSKISEKTAIPFLKRSKRSSSHNYPK